MPQQLKNFSTTTLAADITTTTQTSISLTSVTNIPTSGNFRLVIGSEIMYCTSITGTTATVIRGYELTTASTYATGTAISAEVTVGTLRDLFTDYFTVDVFANRPAAGFLGRRYRCTDLPFTYWDNGTNWQLLKDNLIVPYAPLNVSSGWTNHNFQSGTTVTQAGDSAKFSAKGQNADQLQYITRSLTSTTAYTINCTLDLTNNLSRQYTYALFGIKDSISGKLMINGLIDDGTALWAWVESYTADNGGTEYFFQKYLLRSTSCIMSQIILSSGTIEMNFSMDGNTFYQLYSGSLGSIFSTNPNQVLIGVDPVFGNDANNIPCTPLFHSLSGY